MSLAGWGLDLRAQRIFLWSVAVFVVLLLVAALIWRLAGYRLIEMAMVPSVDFAQSELAPAPDYKELSSWVSRPGVEDDPARWVPEHYHLAPKPQAATFFVPPTAYLDRARWNAPLDDKATNKRLRQMVEGQASIFNGVSTAWVPRYRQAAFGAFLKPGPDTEQALEVAYQDVARSFAEFMARVPVDQPLILAGHSQGALHLKRLLREQGGPELKERLVAVYLIGWPVLDEDLEDFGLPGCTSRAQAGCVLSWQSVAADSETDEHLKTLARGADIGDETIGWKKMLCINPLTGSPEGEAPPEANLGMLQGQKLLPRKVGAECDEHGLLKIAPAPKDIGPYILPNGNFHVYDVALFWANLRADVEARLSAFEDEGSGDDEALDIDMEVEG